MLPLQLIWCENASFSCTKMGEGGEGWPGCFWNSASEHLLFCIICFLKFSNFGRSLTAPQATFEACWLARLPPEEGKKASGYSSIMTNVHVSIPLGGTHSLHYWRNRKYVIFCFGQTRNPCLVVRRCNRLYLQHELTKTLYEENFHRFLALNFHGITHQLPFLYGQ